MPEKWLNYGILLVGLALVIREPKLIGDAVVKVSHIFDPILEARS